MFNNYVLPWYWSSLELWQFLGQSKACFLSVYAGILQLQFKSVLKFLYLTHCRSDTLLICMLASFQRGLFHFYNGDDVVFQKVCFSLNIPDYTLIYPGVM